MLSAWKKGGALPKNVYAMPAEQEDLAQACEAYEQILHDATEGDGIDLSLLGIGEDGHFASLFPLHAGLHETKDVFYLRDSPKPPSGRMSLSLPLIIRSKKIVILALGYAKGQVLKKIKEKGTTPSCPVSLLPRENTQWYCDEAALSALDE